MNAPVVVAGADSFDRLFGRASLFAMMAEVYQRPANGCSYLGADYASGDGYSGDPPHCGSKRKPGSPYCRAHHALAHRKPTEAEQAALRARGW